MKTLKRRVGMTLAMVAAGMVIHAALLHVLAEKNVVAVILSAGPHSPAATLLVAGAFLVMRVLVVLLLPGAILCRCALWAFEYWRERR